MRTSICERTALPPMASCVGRCEQCEYYVTTTEFIPQHHAQLADTTALREDATERGWHTEVARHSRVIASIQNHLQRLERAAGTGHNG